MKFDETITAVSPPSTDVDSLLKYFNEKGIEELSGYTALYAAADSAMNAMTANTPGERRTHAASRKLIEAGISPDRLFILGLGQKHPLLPHDSTPAKAAEHRRVEIIFVE